MKKYLKIDPWKIIEEGFDPEVNQISESIFSLGNGRFGQRANFEETYTGETLQGNYVAGVYYPDKTRVGWWKNGYPEYFAKVLNATNWIGIEVKVNNEILDLATVKVTDFKRVLDMQNGYLERSFTAKLKNGIVVKVKSIRFCSIADDEVGAIKYSITPNADCKIMLTPFLDGDIKNQDSNYDEKFWDFVASSYTNEEAYLTLKTKKTKFEVCTASHIAVLNNGSITDFESKPIEREKFIGQEIDIVANAGAEISLIKTIAILSSENHPKDKLSVNSKTVITKAAAKGFDQLLIDQKEAWANKWRESDIVIDGDDEAQQAIRFNIFQLFQTYTGKDDRLNIGPKGFTGEKYGGSTYWDTEAYCVPFYLATSPANVAKNLLVYRYKHLPKAIENAEKLGFSNGAALYPMVTINGEECHNEWEITFEEIHRNGAIAFAIFNYVRYTGDETYLAEFGLEVLIGIARFWKQRVNWSEEKKQYVMLGVTGPNEYENNISNNWYTNTIAVWCLKYAIEVAVCIKENDKNRYAQIIKTTKFNEGEFADWQKIIDQMYFPENATLGVFLQQDGYLDKEQILVADLPKSERPLNQKWSWDRILRSCFIKQADVLQGFYFFEDQYDIETIKRNFDFYEARTVHESSLSPCVHSILAAKIKDEEKAYEFYLRTARLDLDNYNNDTDDGLHITSMAGTWMTIVEGFAGMRVKNNQLYFDPLLPKKWKSFAFTIGFRGITLKVSIKGKEMIFENLSDKELTVTVDNKNVVVKGKLVTSLSY